ncbi:phosphatidate cytidylyltransferase [Thermoleophilia bacterium SCSIO 60948]|nr:phosphatidate cytidylyltransferase [Thermoleophilia bacterium SCSIO 60948]
MRGEEEHRTSGFFDVEAEEGQAPAPATPAARNRARAGRSPTPRRDPAASRRERSETGARIVWAVPWIAFAIAIVVVGGGIFAAAMLGLAVVCQSELFRMTRASMPLAGVAAIVTAGLVAAAFFGLRAEMLAILLATLPLMFLAIAARGTDGVTGTFAITALGVVWIGLPFAHAVLLREIPEHGLGLVVDVLVATFLADTCAYAGGRAFGRHQLAPRLSPKKTVEGLAFGIAGGAAAFWFAGLYQDWLSGTDALLIGLGVAIVAPIGDLFESVIKRDLGVKDSGTVIGPHGGLLDRLDAVLFTMVAGYWLAVAFGL